MTASRKKIQEMARAYLDKGDPTGWFEALYRLAERDPDQISWAEMAPNPNFVQWLSNAQPGADSRKAVVVGSGLGDDAEALVGCGFEVTAFDISSTAIDWCKSRFPGSTVNYKTADLFDLPDAWQAGFDLVVEIYTLQVLTPDIRSAAMERIAGLTAPAGSLFVLCRGRNPEESNETMPWRLTPDELKAFCGQGMQEISFEDFLDGETPPVRRFRAVYQKSGAPLS